MEKIAHNNDFYSSKISELNANLINENNLKESHSKDKDILAKQQYKVNSENIHFTRTLEKNKLFKENKDDKNKALKDKSLEKFAEIDKLVIRSLLEEESINRKLQNNSKQKLIENENSQIIFTINK